MHCWRVGQACLLKPKMGILRFTGLQVSCILHWLPSRSTLELDILVFVIERIHWSIFNVFLPQTEATSRSAMPCWLVERA